MNEAETRAELIDPAIAAAGWGTVEEAVIRREWKITDGSIQIGGCGRPPPSCHFESGKLLLSYTSS